MHGGAGRLCSVCLLVSSVFDDIDCPFCDGSVFTEKILDGEEIRNAHFIYRCSPNPRKSIKNIQVLKSQELLESWMFKAEKIMNA